MGSSEPFAEIVWDIASTLGNRFFFVSFPLFSGASVPIPERGGLVFAAERKARLKRLSPCHMDRSGS